MAERSGTHRRLALLAGTLGALALAAGEPYPTGRGPTVASGVSFVTAVDVARWIRDGRRGLRIVDVRDDSLVDANHIPGAERIALGELGRHAWARDASLVVYAGDDAAATRAAAVLRRRGVMHPSVLRGGLLAWVDEIVAPRLTALPPTATAAEQTARREQLELGRYFGGTPVVSPAAIPLPTRFPPSEAAAVARIIRRGC
ncbi:MAG: rhodanese-like domain-containing protein [Gemmatimonadota bacterium]|nr:rhodanese-like domain-containing protein [Gemmatimonadota bacterium]